MSQRAPPQRGTPKQRARARVRLRLANDRQSERRDAVHAMNLVAEEYSLPPIPRKASTRRVQRLVRILQQRVRAIMIVRYLHYSEHCISARSKEVPKREARLAEETSRTVRVTDWVM